MLKKQKKKEAYCREVGGNRIRRRTQINKLRNEKGEITTDTAEMQSILRDYYKQLYANKMHNLKEMDKFLER